MTIRLPISRWMPLPATAVEFGRTRDPERPGLARHGTGWWLCAVARAGSAPFQSSSIGARIGASAAMKIAPISSFLSSNQTPSVQGCRKEIRLLATIRESW